MPRYLLITEEPLDLDDLAKSLADDLSWQGYWDLRELRPEEAARLDGHPTIPDVAVTGSARTSDPATSKRAASRNAPGRKAMAWRILAAVSLLRGIAGATVPNVQVMLAAEGFHVERNVIARRLKDLEQLGWAWVMSSDGTHNCWSVTSAGARALAEHRGEPVEREESEVGLRELFDQGEPRA